MATDKSLIEQTSIQKVKALCEESLHLANAFDRFMRRLAPGMANLNLLMEDFVFGMVIPALGERYATMGDGSYRSMGALHLYDKDQQCYDVFGPLVMSAFLNEVMLLTCQARMMYDEVDDHLARLERFKTRVPEYAGFRVHGVVAALIFPRHVADYAFRQGFYVMTLDEEGLNMRHDRRYGPRCW